MVFSRSSRPGTCPQSYRHSPRQPLTWPHPQHHGNRVLQTGGWYVGVIVWSKEETLKDRYLVVLVTGHTAAKSSRTLHKHLYKKRESKEFKVNYRRFHTDMTSDICMFLNLTKKEDSLAASQCCESLSPTVEALAYWTKVETRFLISVLIHQQTVSMEIWDCVYVGLPMCVVRKTAHPE